MNQTPQTEIENLTHKPDDMLVIRYFNNVPHCQLYLPVFPHYKADDIKNRRDNYSSNIASFVQNYELYMAIFKGQYMNRLFGYENDEDYFKIKQEYFTKTLHSIKPHSLNYCQKIDIIIQIAKIIKFTNNQGVAIRSLRPELLAMHKYGENHKQFKLIWMDFPAIIDEDGEIQPDKFSLRDYADFDIYVAPEIKQKKNYGPQVDVWSLGVIFYQLLFGNTNGIAFRKLNAEIQFPNHTPTWLQNVISMFIEIDPKKRCTIGTCLQYLKPMKCCAESAEKLLPKIHF